MDAQDLALMVEYGEARALASSMEVLPPALAQALGARVERIGGAVLAITSGADFVLFNRVIGLGLAEPASEAQVDAIVACYRPLGVQCMVQLSPLARPAALPVWLEARGFVRRDQWAKVYRGTEPPPAVPTDLRIEQIGPELAAVYAATGADAFSLPARARPLQPWFSAGIGRPGWTHFLSFAGDTPAGIGALYVADGVGSLFGGGTRAEFRRRGGQGAIMAARIRAALAQGCRWVVTETGEDRPEDPNPSYHNMLRTGFQLAYLRPNYILPVAAPAAPLAV